MNQKHSGFGIASFLIAIAVTVLLFLLFVAAGVIESSTPGGMNEESPIAIILGLMLFACLFADIIAFIFGIVGLLQPDRSKIFSILGLVFVVLTVLGGGGLIVLGLMMDGPM